MVKGNPGIRYSHSYEFGHLVQHIAYLSALTTTRMRSVDEDDLGIASLKTINFDGFNSRRLWF